MMEKLFSLFNKIPHDKALHALSGAFVFALLQASLRVFLPLRVSALFAIACVLVVAVVKELYDGRHPDTHTKDWYDALATIGGGMLGVLCVYHAC